MTHLFLPDDNQRRLVFYLAIEEYMAEQIGQLSIPQSDSGEKEILFLWQSRPTVIFGRHQDMQVEVNIPWCEANGVEMYRRKSGGGCVYSDEGNLMLSYITTQKEPQMVFQHYLDMLSGVLRQLGLEAVSSSHNDVMIGEKKVSGNACFAGKEATIVHGTLLWRSNMDNLTQAITPSEEKLAKHAVKSVRQRVGNLYEMGVTDMAALKEHIIHSLCTSDYMLTSEDMAAIEQIEQTYLAPEFICGEKVLSQ